MEVSHMKSQWFWQYAQDPHKLKLEETLAWKEAEGIVPSLAQEILSCTLPVDGVSGFFVSLTSTILTTLQGRSHNPKHLENSSWTLRM